VPTLVERLLAVELTGAERRVGDLIARDLRTVAFGTVAEIASAANTGGATVMRLATKLGFDGFRALQDASREELTRTSRPAAVRARLDLAGSDPIERALDVEITNVQRSLAALTPAMLRSTVDLLLKARRVGVVSSDATIGVATDFSSQLSMVRADVGLAIGSTAATTRAHAWLSAKDVLVAFDIARYEVAVTAIVAHARGQNVPVIAITDSPLAAIAADASHVLTVQTEGPGPFDSLVGMLCVTNVIAAHAVSRRGATATAHLDRLEASWTELGTLDSE
jgi:DNA-binding MurR/RpiR family transcriptional regulator